MKIQWRQMTWLKLCSQQLNCRATDDSDFSLFSYFNSPYTLAWDITGKNGGIIILFPDTTACLRIYKWTYLVIRRGERIDNLLTKNIKMPSSKNLAVKIIEDKELVTTSKGRRNS